MLVELQGRAEGAETAMKILQENFEAVASENNLLRVALEELQERKIKIKQVWRLRSRYDPLVNYYLVRRTII